MIVVPKTPRKRTCKRHKVKMAEAVEQMLLSSERYRSKLDDKGQARAALIRQILFDMQNYSQVHCSDRRLVKAYILACYEDQWGLDPGDYDSVQESFKDIKDLLDGYVTDPSLSNSFKTDACTEERFEEIDRRYNAHLRDPELQAQEKSILEKLEHKWQLENASELEKLRDKLERIERLPENEAELFRLRTEIYNLENGQEEEEWPDLVS